jgi:hypothetical protein
MIVLLTHGQRTEQEGTNEWTNERTTEPEGRGDGIISRTPVIHSRCMHHRKEKIKKVPSREPTKRNKLTAFSHFHFMNGFNTPRGRTTRKRLLRQPMTQTDVSNGSEEKTPRGGVENTDRYRGMNQ